MCGTKRCKKPDCTWSEKFRRECEARCVCAMQNRKLRLEYIRDIKRIRGERAAQELMDEVHRQWKLRCRDGDV